MRKACISIALMLISVVSSFSVPCDGVANPCDAASASFADVSAAVGLTPRNGTLHIPAGSPNWGGNILFLSRGIHLLGPGVSALHISGSGYGPAHGFIEIWPLESAVDDGDVIEIAYFSMDGLSDYEQHPILVNSVAPTLAIHKPYRGLKIHDLHISHIAGFFINGQNRGVIYLNDLDMVTRPLWVGGADNVDGTVERALEEFNGQFPFSYGNSDNLFYEDNYMHFSEDTTFAPGANWGYIESGQGGRVCVRYNHWDYENAQETNLENEDMHGFQGWRNFVRVFSSGASDYTRLIDVLSNGRYLLLRHGGSGAGDYAFSWTGSTTINAFLGHGPSTPGWVLHNSTLNDTIAYSADDVASPDLCSNWLRGSDDAATFGLAAIPGTPALRLTRTVADGDYIQDPLVLSNGRYLLLRSGGFGASDYTFSWTGGTTINSLLGHGPSMPGWIFRSTAISSNVYYSTDDVASPISCQNWHYASDDSSVMCIGMWHPTVGETGTMIAEVYGNWINNFNAGRAFLPRGSKHLYHNNQYSNAVGDVSGSFVRVGEQMYGNDAIYESGGCTYEVEGVLGRSVAPLITTINDSYVWSNIGNGVEFGAVPSLAGCGLAENVNYWNYNPSFGNGTNGIGRGTSNPTTTGNPDGAAYWVAPVTIPHYPDPVADAASIQAGHLWKKVAGVWTDYYQPYTYPHPLRAGDTPPPDPTPTPTPTATPTPTPTPTATPTIPPSSGSTRRGSITTIPSILPFRP